jgi:hypothetical protein
MARILELRVHRSKLFDESTGFGRKMYNVFLRNYGWAGREFVKVLMRMDKAILQNIVETAVAEFTKKYGKTFTGVERYWELIYTLVDISLSIAAKNDIVRFGPEPGVEWALGQIGDMREMVKDNQRDMFDLVAEYANEFANNTVRVYHSPDADPFADEKFLPRGPVRVRIDAYRAKGATGLTSGVLYLDRSHFRRWFAKRGENPRELVNLLNAEGANMTPKSQKASLGKNTPLSIPQCYVIGIDITHPRLASILSNADESYRDMEMKQLMSPSLGDGVHKPIH